MQFGYAIIYVPDVQKAVDFYQKAFSLTLKFLHDSKQYAEMTTGQTTLAFVSDEAAKNNGLNFRPNRLNQLAAGFEVAFITDNVKASFETALAAGAKPISIPTTKPWGQTVAYVTDLNGVLVEICDAMQE